VLPPSSFVFKVPLFQLLKVLMSFFNKIVNLNLVDVLVVFVEVHVDHIQVLDQCVGHAHAFVVHQSKQSWLEHKSIPFLSVFDLDHFMQSTSHHFSSFRVLVFCQFFIDIYQLVCLVAVNAIHSRQVERAIESHSC
jgi:hypothetical protein